MEAKYVKALQAGFSGGLVIFCLVALLTITNMQLLICLSWMAIILLLAGIGALSVKMSLVTSLNDALVVSAVAGITAAVLNSVGLIVLNVFTSIIDWSIAGLVTSVICWTPVAFILGIIFPVIGGGLWHFARTRELIK